MIADTPKPPYYAVIFTTLRTDVDDGYGDMSEKMVAMAKEQPGFLGYESARSEVGITVSYWESLEAIKGWKNNADHKIARDKGRSHWYSTFKARICLVERDYGFDK